MIGIVIYLLGVAVQYVRVNTVHKEWKKQYLQECKRNYDVPMFHQLAVIGSWLAFIIMNTKRFLDTKFINK
jgi:NADH:ubiquinone oxidoreductase subunit 6 (subunit J)